MYLFEAGENAPPSSVTFGGAYTNTDTWAGAVGTQTHFTDDKYRMAGWIGFFNANVDFYGIGNEAGDRGIPVPINQRGPFFVPSFLFRVANNLYLGPQYRLLTVDTSVDKSGLPPGHPAEILPDVFTVKSSGLGVVLDYDKLDNRFYPHHGSFLDVNTNFARETIGSDRNYEQYEAGYNLFREVGEEQILAWRATGCFTEGDTPYYDLCNFGGEFDSIRGYVGGQYRDDVSLTTQLEYRWRFYKKWGMVAFGGIGQVAPNLSEMTASNILPSAGLGVRFRASEKDRVNLSIDYARGKDSNAWYFRIGEAF
jgi:outer membrane protein assembly factor BamA